MAEKEVKVTAVVTVKLRREARMKAARTGKSMSSIMREALESWVAEDSPEEAPISGASMENPENSP